MEKYIIKEIFIILILTSCLLLFKNSFNVTYATGDIFSDANGLDDMFKFSEDVKDDMKFKGADASDNDTFWTKIFGNYSIVLIGGSGLAALTFVFFFVLNVVKLITTSGNPDARRKSIITLMWTGASGALLGGLTILVSISSGLFK